MVLDSFDREILALMQKNSRMTSEALAEAVCLSPTAVQRRLKKLREGGVIRKEVAVLDAQALGRPLMVVAQVSMEREQPDVLDAFKEDMLARQEVQQCYYLTGDMDFLLLLTVESMADYEAFTRQLFFSNPNIRRFTTSVVMDQVKAGLEVPL
ncbi:Lrp/AsnC family transcriptional regulator [Rhodovibrionaceae bacterium A322]